ncbi:hypothetical protein [Granulicatella balaenopterae]|nr:hypothetical protein [Granulicatella balaenopterae]
MKKTKKIFMVCMLFIAIVVIKLSSVMRLKSEIAPLVNLTYHQVFIYSIIPIITLFIIGFIVYILLTSISTDKNMGEYPKFDEYQVAIRNKYAFNSLMIMTTLVILTSLKSSAYTFAEPIAEGIIILFIPLLYFSTMLKLKGAYAGYNKEKSNLRLNLISLIAGLVFCYIIYLSINDNGLEFYYKDGIIQNNIVQLVVAINAIYFSVLGLVVDTLKNKNSI